MAHHRQPHQHEFLPLCDVLFNIISLASYFCDVVFDLVMVYALAYHSIAPPILFPLSISLIASSLFISQIVSIRWYLWGARGKLTINNTIDNCNINQERKTRSWTLGCVLLLHSTQVGVLWRYFKLFIPVNLAYVKHEVRELCVLRLIHAFCEAAPMLLLQSYLLSIGIATEPNMESEEVRGSEMRDGDKLTKLTAVSAGLSLWSVCWAVASFSKGAARLRNLERLVLTWLGVLTQLAWRLGTVSARVGALVAYASVYGGQWLLVVMALHWLSMLTWLLLTPDGLFHGGERLPLVRKTFLASLLAYIYIFAYVNLHETNHRQKMVIFYTVMLLENSLLIGVWITGINRSDFLSHQHHLQPVTLILTLLALFFGGMFFMGLYYRFCHVRRLRYEAGGRMTGSNHTTLSQDNTEEKQMEYMEEKKLTVNIAMRKVKLSNGGIPGVFNCRFANPTAVNPNRKKKKPTTFVPPPPPQSQATSVTTPATTVSGDTKHWSNGNTSNSRQLIPFWKKPVSSDATQNNRLNEQKNGCDVGISGSLSVNLIREKLREKKQQQLRELRAIQEEIKEGKLFPPPSASTSSFSSSPSISNQQPPPNAKLHTSPSSPLFTSATSLPEGGGVTLSSWPPVKMHCLFPPPPSSPYYLPQHPSNPWRMPQRERADTPEILLAPRCLPHHYSHWTPSGHVKHRLHTSQNGEEEGSKGEGEGEGEISDMEGSQVSLPRSYTLPREFKYNHPNNVPKDRERRGGSNKLSSRFYLPSTNSSDGDVDSADNEEETDSELQNHVKAREEHKQDAVQYSFENGQAVASSNLNNNSVTSVTSVTNCSNDSHGGLRPNQLFRIRVKHETKL